MHSAALRHATAGTAAALIAFCSLRVALFSCDSLVDAARGPGCLLQVAGAAFNQ